MKNVKWMAAVVLGLALTQTVFGAALVTKGSQELAVQGRLDFESAQGTDFSLVGQYGYFFLDRVSIGVRMGLGDNDAASSLAFGGVCEYNFRLSPNYRPLIGTDLVPYVGGAVEYRHVDIKHSDDQDAMVFGAEGGVKFFLTDTAAVTTSLVGEWATEKIFPDKHKWDSMDFRLCVGMRFYF